VDGVQLTSRQRNNDFVSVANGKQNPVSDQCSLSGESIYLSNTSYDTTPDETGENQDVGTKMNTAKRVG